MEIAHHLMIEWWSFSPPLPSCADDEQLLQQQQQPQPQPQPQQQPQQPQQPQPQPLFTGSAGASLEGLQVVDGIVHRRPTLHRL